MSQRYNVAIALAISVAIAGTARAQEALDEVTITAQKREQSVQDVGIAVTAFSDEQIRELGFTSSTDVVAMTPGLHYTVPNAESSQINFFLRGVGLNDFADANENPVAVYVDDIYRPAMGGLSFQLFDTERVEVLKGPQGTLFGRNTTGGLVHFVSKRPTREFDGYVDLTAAEYGQVKFEGAVGGPLGDTVAARLAVATNKHDGYTENRFPGAPDYNETDSYAARGQLLFTPSETFDALVGAYYSKNDAAVGAWQHQATTLGGPNGDQSVPLGPNEQSIAVNCNTLDPPGEPTDARPAPGTDCFGYRDTDNDPWAGEYDRDGKVEVETQGFWVNANWEIGGVTLTSITGFQNVDRLQSEDTEASPAPLIQPTFRAETDTLTQELRASGGSERFHWLGGLYYFDNEVDGHYTLDLTNLGFVLFDANYNQQTESWAAFGQLEFGLTEQLTLIAGLRVANEEKELDYLNRDLAGFMTGVLGLPTDVAFDFDRSTVGDLARHDEDSVNGRLGLDWKPNDDLLIYGSISRGTKSAGFNVGFLDETFTFASNTIATIPYGEETLTSYEVGFKSMWGGHTRLNGAAFYYDYEDFQTFQFELLNQIIFNSSAEVSGVELELQSSPVEGWHFGLGLSVLDATAKDIPNPYTGELRDRDMVASPDIAANAVVRYEWPAARGRFAIQGTVNYQDEIWYDIQNVPVSLEDGYTIGNLRFSYASEDGDWELAAFVNNVTDEEYLSYTFDFTATFGFNQQAYGQPRWAGVSFRYNFK